MPRIRSIKPETFRDELLAELPHEVKWTYVGLWSYVDDEGRGLDNPRLVKAEVWPLDDSMTAERVEDHLDMLASLGRIRRYEAEGKRVFVIVKWLEHQRISKPAKSKLPAPPPPEPDPPPPNGAGKSQGSPRKPRAARGNPPRSREQGAGISADGGAPAGEPDDPPATDEQRIEARRIVNGFWQRVEPKPAVKWIALVKIVTRFVVAGWSASQIEQALDRAKSFTVNAIEFELRGGAKPNLHAVGPEVHGTSYS